MNSFLYIWRSVTRRSRVHINMLVILACALVLPLIVSFVHDSIVYGSQMQSVYNTGDSHFQIRFVNESDFTIWYENDTLFFKSKIGINADNHTLLYDKILSSFAELNNGDSILTDMIGMYNTVENERTSYQINIILTLFVGIAIWIISAAYRVHIGYFKTEIGILTSIGANSRTIITLFATELAILFIGATLLALGMANAIVRLLYMFFLQIDSGKNLGWSVFHINPTNTVFVIAVMLICITVMFLYIIRHTQMALPTELLQTTANDDKLIRKKRNCA